VTETTAQRITFLDCLRGFACGLVVIGHIYLVGTVDPKTVSLWVPTVSTYIFGPDPNLGNPYAHLLNSLTQITGLGVGALGVAIFFLVSGFIILRTIDREPWKQFLTRRVFRIFPTNMVAVLVTAAITAAFCHFSGVANPNSLRGVASSSLLIMNYTQTFVVIPVLWTLEIEMLFYLMIGVAAACVQKIDGLTLCLMSVICLCLAGALGYPHQPAGTSPASKFFMAHLSLVMTCMTFLLIGSAIYRAWESRWAGRSWVCVAACIALHLLAYCLHGLETQWSAIGFDLINGLCALLIFAAALWLRMEWAWLGPLRWFGSVSYPLYLIHVPLGWMLLAWLAGHGWDVHEAGSMTLAVVTGFAWVLHLAIEKPSQRLGKTVANELFSASGASTLATR
jgi:peptidoglycan/LPS O-acetylase OafA/YrhL